MTLRFLDAPGASARDVGVVGAKAATLMQMADVGLRVPPGFVLGTDVCAGYLARGASLSDGDRQLIFEGLREIERSTGRSFGATRRPLLLSVRSGAAVSMPGMLDTVLDVGLCDATLPGLLRATGDPIFVWDSYRRLVQAYAEVVGGVGQGQLRRRRSRRRSSSPAPPPSPSSTWRRSATLSHGCSISTPRPRATVPSGSPAPAPRSDRSGDAVLECSRERSTYRRLAGLDRILTARPSRCRRWCSATWAPTSGSGVAFTRSPATGENRLYVDFLLDAQGEDVVGGRAGVGEAESSIAAIRGLMDELQRVKHAARAAFGDAQDFEFTVEDGHALASAEPTGEADALGRAADRRATSSTRGCSTRRRPSSASVDIDLERIRRRVIAPEEHASPCARGAPASTGTATGPAAMGADAVRAATRAGTPAILVRHDASTEDVALLAECAGLLTAFGARTSHAAVVARQLGAVCVVACPLTIDAAVMTVRIGDALVHEGSWITIDGGSGDVYASRLALCDETPDELLARVRSWRVAPVGCSRAGSSPTGGRERD